MNAEAKRAQEPIDPPDNTPPESSADEPDDYTGAPIDPPDNTGGGGA